MIDLDKIPAEWQDDYTRYQSMTAERGCEAIEEIARLTEQLKERKTAPVQGFSAGIPWAMHLRAYDAYCKRYGEQKALIEGWCRGGFGTNELDIFIPGWRDELSELQRLRTENAEKDRIIAALKTAKEDAMHAVVYAASSWLDCKSNDDHRWVSLEGRLKRWMADAEVILKEGFVRGWGTGWIPVAALPRGTGRGNRMNPEIKNQVCRYLAGEISLTDFRVWFASVWVDNLSRKVASILGEISDFDEGFCSESELQCRLLELIQPLEIITGTSTKTVCI